MSMKVFKEEQRFTQLWIIILLAISVLVPVVIIIIQFLQDKGSFSTTEFILVISLTVLLPLVIFLFKLYTKIDEQGVHYKFFPFHLKLRTIAWQEISKAYVRRYDAISEYGGWGLKGGAFWRKSKGIAINVSGDIGIQLELKNGKKILIGTKLEDQAKQAINHYNFKIKNHENKE